MKAWESIAGDAQLFEILLTTILLESQIAVEELQIGHALGTGLQSLAVVQDGIFEPGFGKRGE
jgi:hypothetical protein